VFQYYFYQHHLLLTSMVTIWLHGTLEISAIVIASGGGITMGSGLLFPGTHSRAQSFFLSARRGIKILMGIVPIIIVAAIIESYLTRYTDAPLGMKLTLIFLSLFFILFYFVWYPYKKSREVPAEISYESAINPSTNAQFDFSTIHSNGNVFSEIFNVYKQEAGKIIKWSLLCATLASVGNYFIAGSDILRLGKFQMIAMVFNYSNNFAFFLVNVSVFSVFVFILMKMIAIKAKPAIKTGITGFLRIVLFSAFINAFFFMSSWLAILLYLVIGPFYLQWMYVSFFESKNVFSSFSRAFSLIDSALGKALGFFLMALISATCFFLLIDSPLLGLYKQILTWNISMEESTMRSIDIFLSFFFPYFTAFIVMPLIIFGNFLEYFTLVEISEGNGLLKKIRSLKK
jgi:uncharacterized membrane protein SpoIIM required for sporulation